MAQTETGGTRPMSTEAMRAQGILVPDDSGIISTPKQQLTPVTEISNPIAQIDRIREADLLPEVKALLNQPEPTNE